MVNDLPSQHIRVLPRVPDTLRNRRLPRRAQKGRAMVSEVEDCREVVALGEPVREILRVR